MRLYVGGCRGWGEMSPSVDLNGNAVESREFGTLKTCFLIQRNNDYIVVDGGSGAANVGKWLVDHSASKDGGKYINCLMTHGHGDHTYGWPLFKPLFQKENAVHFYAPCLNPASVELSRTSPGAVARRMSRWDAEDLPFALESLPSIGQFADFIPGERFDIAASNVEVDNFLINHPGGAVAYSIKDLAGGRGIVIATDYETDFGPRDEAFKQWLQSKKPDMLVMDGQYLRPEHMMHGYSNRFMPGWGHSDPYDCVAIAASAGIPFLAITHHDVSNDDSKLRTLEAKVRSETSRSSGVETFFLRESDQYEI